MNKQEAIKAIRDAGVVGAGGAGFPTWKKMTSEVEYLIANGAECEPLLFKDRETMINEAEKFIIGLQLMQSLVNASKVVIAIKEKNIDILDILKPLTADLGYEYKIMRNVYPAGDEYVLVYEITGRQIPPGGLPLDVGAVVNNVETMVNVAKAVVDAAPLTEKFVTVNGAVHEPLTTAVPIGTSFEDLIDLAGGPTVDDFVVFTGGIMMGGVETKLDQPLTKTNSGLIVLPADHYLVKRKTASKKAYTGHGHSACDQCSLCTELCFRYLLGYPIHPHKVMRTMQLQGKAEESASLWAQFCCECNICSLFACPEGLDPKSICVDNKQTIRDKGLKWTDEALANSFLAPHPVRSGREIPMKQLVLRLGLTELDQKAPFKNVQHNPLKVEIPLQQHIGVAGRPLVSEGDKVDRGQVLSQIPDTALGVPIHASIDGVVKKANETSVIIER
jgi:Na+-translocating ferredoxin:NAD+ oxidoreductase RnfC subunit